MPAPLVLKNGLISEQLSGEVGQYPLLRLVAGALRAGGPGLDIQFISGALRQVLPSMVGGDWDGGLSIWDAQPAVWDSGLTTWESAWDSEPAVWS